MNTWSFNQLVLNYEKTLLEKALKETNGNMAKAARLCGLAEGTFKSKVKKQSIDVGAYRPLSSVLCSRES